MTTQTNAKPTTQSNAKGATTQKGGNAIGKPGNQDNSGNAIAKQSNGNSKADVKAAIAKRPLTIGDAINVTGSVGDAARGRKPLLIPVKVLCEQLPCCLEMPLGRTGKPQKYSQDEMQKMLSDGATNPHTGKPYQLMDLMDAKTWHYASDSVCLLGKDWLEKEPEAVLPFTKGALTQAYASIVSDKWLELQALFADGDGDGGGEENKGEEK